MTRRFTLWLGSMAALSMPSIALSAEYYAGDSCAEAGAFHTRNDSSGVYHLVCNGSTWTFSTVFLKDDPVGIGDDTPDGDLTLDVGGKVGATEYCDASGANCFVSASVGNANAAGPDRSIQFNNSSALSGTTSFVYTSAGRLGVGTSTPVELLQVLGTIAADTVYNPSSTIKLGNSANGVVVRKDMSIASTDTGNASSYLTVTNGNGARFDVKNFGIGIGVNATWQNALTFGSHGTIYSPSLIVLTSGSGPSLVLSNRARMNSNSILFATQTGHDGDAHTLLNESYAVFTKNESLWNYGDPGSRVVIKTTASSRRGLIVQGAASQSANLTEWQDSIGTVLSRIDKDGALWVSAGSAATPSIRFGTQADGLYLGAANTFLDVALAGAQRARFGTGSLRIAGHGSAATPMFSSLTSTNSGFYFEIGGSNNPPAISHAGNQVAEFGYYQGSTIWSRAAGYPALKVRAHASQTANIQEWQNSGGTILAAFSSSGSLAIGKSTPTVALDVDGDIHYTGTIADVSDRRLKDHITPLVDQLEKITALQPVSFTMKGDTQTELGLIAQDVEALFPVLVRTNPDGMKTLNYVGLIGPLIQALKEQQQEIDVLRAENNSLSGRLEEIETQLRLHPARE